MINLEDERGRKMAGGYKTMLDPRPLIAKFDSAADRAEVWKQLWDELYHQGYVGEASFAAIPLLVETYRRRGDADWATFALIAIIELARNHGGNPDVPDWFASEYFQSITELAEMGSREILHADCAESARAILSVIALQKGLRTHARILVNYSDEERLELESSVGGGPFNGRGRMSS